MIVNGICGSLTISASALSTPTWYAERAPPPGRTKAIAGMKSSLPAQTRRQQNAASAARWSRMMHDCGRMQALS
jgi:hypothetical protein